MPFSDSKKTSVEKTAKNQKKVEKVEIKEKPKKVTPGYFRIILNTLKVILFILAFLCLSFSGAVFAYHTQYENRAMYGTKILGIDVGGKTDKEIKQLVEQKANSITLSFNVDGQEFIASPQDAGIEFKLVDSAKEAVNYGKKGNFLNKALFSAASLIYKVYPKGGEVIEDDIKNNLSLTYKVNDEKLGTFTQNLSNKFNVDSKNAGLVMNGSEVQVIPAVQGRKIMTESIKKQLEIAIREVKTEKIKIEVERVNPGILEDDTKESIEAAKAIINLPVSFHYKGQNFVPAKNVIGEWIIFNTKTVNGKEKLVPQVDSKKVYPYVYNLASKINIPAVNKKVTVKNGGEQVVEREGKNGLAVDADQASTTTANSLSSGKGVDLELPTYEVKYRTQVNNIIVADWAKYIEVNISAQRMCAYLAGGVVQNCWAVTTGANGWNTPTGTFLIQRKSGAGGAPGPYGGGVCMPNPPSSTPLCGINYVSTFTGQGHAIHEAWWRKSFGGQDYKWNGSHGCVNATYDIAKWIYYWAPIGTPVIVHY